MVPSNCGHGFLLATYGEDLQSCIFAELICTQYMEWDLAHFVEDVPAVELNSHRATPVEKRKVLGLFLGMTLEDLSQEETLDALVCSLISTWKSGVTILSVLE